jgi:hypothetical protein
MNIKKSLHSPAVLAAVIASFLALVTGVGVWYLGYLSEVPDLEVKMFFQKAPNDQEEYKGYWFGRITNHSEIKAEGLELVVPGAAHASLRSELACGRNIQEIQEIGRIPLGELKSSDSIDFVIGVSGYSSDLNDQIRLLHIKGVVQPRIAQLMYPPFLRRSWVAMLVIAISFFIAGYGRGISGK